MLPETSYFRLLEQELNKRGVRVESFGFSQPPFYRLSFRADHFRPAISQAIYLDYGEGLDGYELFVLSNEVHRVLITGAIQAMVADADLIAGKGQNT